MFLLSEARALMPHLQQRVADFMSQPNIRRAIRSNKAFLRRLAGGGGPRPACMWRQTAHAVDQKAIFHVYLFHSP